MTLNTFLANEVFFQGEHETSEWVSVIVTLLWKYCCIIKNKLQYCKTKRTYVLQWSGSQTLLNSSKLFPIYDLSGSGSWCAKTVASDFWHFVIKSISRSDGFGFYINRRCVTVFNNNRRRKNRSEMKV